jgi:hypothetical protein
VAGVACSSGSSEPAEVSGRWDRIEHWEQRSSFDYDRIATASSPDAVAWFTRQPANQGGGLAYWEIEGGGDPTQVDVPVGAAVTVTDGVGAASVGGRRRSVVIPVALATDSGGWAAVSVTRDVPRGPNTGLMAWQARAGASAVRPGRPLVPPRPGLGPPESVSVGRSIDTIAVAALYDGDPVIWTRQADKGRTDDSGDPWRSGFRELDSARGKLTSLRLTGDGDRLVLAGVSADGTPRLWTSTDGHRWTTVDAARLPSRAGAVGLLTSLDDGALLVGWLDREASAPVNATSATLQQLDRHNRLVGEGTLTADRARHIDRVHLTGAARSPDDRLVVVGAAVGADGVSTPMAWAQDGDRWMPSRQATLAGHLDHEFRVVVRADDRLLAIAAGMAHPDVEAWRWRPDP